MNVRPLFAALLLLPALACEGHPFSAVTQVATGSAATTFNLDQVQGTDVLFVIDSSNSMADKQQRLIANTNAFITALVASGNAFRVGIVTTDALNPGQRGELHELRPGQRWLDAPLPTEADVAAKRAALIKDFQAGVLAVSIYGDGRESGLGMALVAVGGVAAPADVAQANKGFVRPTADLAIIILSDEDDCSRTPASWAANPAVWGGDDCYRPDLQPQLYTGQQTVAALTAAKAGDVRRVRAAVIGSGVTAADGSFKPTGCVTAGNGVSDACGCWSRSGVPGAAYYCAINTALGQPCNLPAATGPDAISGCDAATSCVPPDSRTCLPQCIAMGAHRYNDFLQALAAARNLSGAQPGTRGESVCLADYSQALLNIASDVVAPTCYSLPRKVTRSADAALTLQRIGPDHRLSIAQPVPRLDPSDPSACHDCAACPTGAWRLASSGSACLTCGLLLHPGDDLHIEVLTDDVKGP